MTIHSWCIIDRCGQRVESAPFVLCKLWLVISILELITTNLF